MTRTALWMYQLRGQQFGPVSPAELRQLAKDGKLTPNDSVRSESHEKWSLASNVEGLFPELGELALDVTPDTIVPPVKAHSGSSPPPVPTAASPPAIVPPAIVPPAIVPPAIVLSQPIDAMIMAKVEPLSPGAIELKRVVSDAVWKRLVHLQLPVGDDLFWTRLVAFRSRRKEATPEAAQAKGLWKLASEKIASLAETAEIQTNRYLVASSDGRFWVTNQLAAVGEAWSLPIEAYQLLCHWKSCELTVDFLAKSEDAEVEFAQFKIDLSRPSMQRGYGSPNEVIATANAGLTFVPADCWTCYPLVGRVKPARLGSFFSGLDVAGRIGTTAVTESAICFGDESQNTTLPFASVVAWRKDDGCLTCIHDMGGRLQYLSLATNAAVALVDDAASFIDKISAATKAAADDTNESPPELSDAEQTAPTEATKEPKQQLPIAEVIGVDDRNLPRRSLDSVLQSLRGESADKFCERQMLAAEFSATPLFGTPGKRLLIVCRDDQVHILVSNVNHSSWHSLQSPQLHSLAGRWFAEAAGGEFFELCVDNENEPIVAAVEQSLQSTGSSDANNGSLVLLAPTEDQNDGWASALPFRVHFGEHGALRFEASGENQAIGSFECAAESVDKKSRVWNELFGTATLAVPGGDRSVQLVAPRATLIRIWETRELAGLRKRTQGITLGEMYTQYNEMRTRKFVTGIFGNYFLAQQRLELRSPLDDFIKEIESSPSGVLPEKLEMELIERLSVLEISRNQLNRWLDRCTLMYPHQQADLTRRWLEETFGSEVISRENCDQESWRVHQQTRGDLRQVQASMSRAMAEVGQNLNAIAFAFPEEVRCAALAATRRAASMAGKGAMVAAFAGMGGQMLMGLGRASIGDPMGIALLGTVGMSMLGKHLEKNAKETEKKIRIRAYGIQALQWWKVVLETAAVMALESRHTIEQTQKAAMLRDRKLLESMPREKLPQTQKRMAAVMLAMLHEEVGNQFYEALPGSGVFGWHIVDHMSEMTTTQPKVVLKSFSGEVPGSLAVGVNDVRRNVLQ